MFSLSTAGLKITCRPRCPVRTYLAPWPVTSPSPTRFRSRSRARASDADPRWPPTSDTESRRATDRSLNTAKLLRPNFRVNTCRNNTYLAFKKVWDSLVLLIGFESVSVIVSCIDIWQNMKAETENRKASPYFPLSYRWKPPTWLLHGIRWTYYNESFTMSIC